MLKRILILFVGASVLISCAAKIAVKNTDKYDLLGSEIVKDIALRQVVNMVFIKKLTNKERFSYLSKQYLQKYYPDIKTADEYDKYLKEIVEEKGETKYLQISNLIEINDNEVHIELILEAPDGPGSKDYEKIRKRYSFIKQGGRWKYNDSVRGSYEVLE